MPNEERIDSILDRSAIEKELQFLSTNLAALSETIKSFPAIKTNIEGASNVKELSKAQIQYAESLKAVEQLVKQRFASEAKLATAQSSYAKAIAANRAELQKNNAELKTQAQYEAASTGSIDKARAAIKNLTAERNKLNLYTDEGREKQAKLNEQIDKYNNFIKKSVSLLEQQKINVGNYAGSLAKPFESLQRTLDKLKSGGLPSFAPTGNPATDQGRQATARQLQSDLDKVFVKASREGANAQQQVKQLEVAFQKLSLAADPADKEMRAFLTKFKQEVGEAKDAVNDLRDEIKLSASDTKGIDNVIGSLNALAGIAQGAAGAYALFGASEEDAAKVTSKLIAVQGIANSIQQVSQELTKKGTIANKIYEASLKTMSTIFDSTATAGARLRAVLTTLGVGAVIVGIGLLINYFSKANDTFDATKEAMNGAKDAFAEASKTVFELRQNIDLARKGFIDKEAVVKQYNETMGKTAGTVTTLDEAEQKVVEKGPAYIRFMFLKAQANYALAQAAQIAAEAQVAAANSQERIAKAGNAKIKIGDFLGIGGTTINVADQLRKQANEELDVLTQKGIAYAKVFQNLQNQLTDIAVSNKFNLLPTDDPKKESNPAKKQTAKKQTAQLKQLIDEQFELYKIYQQRLIKTLRETVDDEKQTLDERLSALALFTSESQQLRRKELDNELRILEEKKRGKSKQEQGEIEKEINIAVAKALDDRKQLYIDFEKEKTKLQEDGAKKSERTFTLATNQLAGIVTSASEKELELIKQAHEDKLTAERAYHDRLKAFYKETYSAIKDIVDQIFQQQIERADKAEQDVDERLNRRRDLINSSGLSDTEKIKQVAQAEKAAFIEKEQIERKKEQLEKRRKLIAKLAGSAEIIAETSKTVFTLVADVAKAKAQAALLAANPFTAAYAPFAIAAAASIASQIPLVIAGGAFQLAKLNFFRKGTQSAPKGPAVVGEDGSELMIDTSGRMSLSPNKPTLMDLAGGERIFPANLTRDILQAINYTISNPMQLANKSQNGENENTKLQKEIISNLQAIKDKTGIIINNQIGIETTAYYKKHMKG